MCVYINICRLNTSKVLKPTVSQMCPLIPGEFKHDIIYFKSPKAITPPQFLITVIRLGCIVKNGNICVLILSCSTMIADQCLDRETVAKVSGQSC